MFIQTKYSGYNRNGEQSAAGRFLILMQPKNDSVKYPQYSGKCADCGRNREEHDTTTQIPVCEQHGVIARIKAQIVDGIRKPNSSKIDITDEQIEAWTDAFEAGCTVCAEIKRLKTEIGCRYFRPRSISYPLRAIVRYARLRQFGHFMMGSARIGSERITLSGSYGGDGLPCSVSDASYDAGVELPTALYDAWNNGGGWNGAGSEASQMRDWALKTFSK